MIKQKSKSIDPTKPKNKVNYNLEIYSKLFIRPPSKTNTINATMKLTAIIKEPI